MGYLARREAAAAGPQPLGDPPAESKAVGPYPALFEFLAARWWEDGSPREPGSLTLFFEDGKVKVCLSDRDQGVNAFLSASCFHEALLRVEKGIVANSLDWRASKASQGARKGSAR